MENKNLEKQIEAILFYKAEPMSVDDLCHLTESTKNAVIVALKQLSDSLNNHGITVVSNNNQYSLATSRDTSVTIERLVKDELSRDLSPASLETLSIVAYKGPISRREIEYVRGVNSSFSLRALLMRGLIERETSRLDERIFLYRPSHDLLLHLGIQSIEQLPEWQSVHEEMEKVNSAHIPDEEEV